MIAKNVRWRRVATRLVIVCTAVAAATVMVWAAKNSSRIAYQGNGKDTKTKSVEKLERLRQKYATLSSVHIVADVQITLYGPNSRSGTGTYEYWAQGDRYKMKCHTDDRLGLLKDRDVAYDGKRFYFFDHGSELLSIQQQDVAKTTGALTNPLFLPVAFLSIEDDDCPACGLRLADFKSPSERWNHRGLGMEVKSLSKDERTGSGLTDLEVPGGTEGKRAFKLHVRLEDTIDGRTRPLQIDRMALDGSSGVSYTFDNFAQSDLGDFPRTIKVEGFDENSSLVARLVYTIRTLETNQPIDNSSFTVNFDEAPGIWDSDGRRFIKERPPKPRRK